MQLAHRIRNVAGHIFRVGHPVRKGRWVISKQPLRIGVVREGTSSDLCCWLRLPVASAVIPRLVPDVSRCLFPIWAPWFLPFFLSEKSSSRHLVRVSEAPSLVGYGFFLRASTTHTVVKSTPPQLPNDGSFVRLSSLCHRSILLHVHCSLTQTVALSSNACRLRSEVEVAMTGRWRQSARERIVQRQRERQHRPGIVDDRDELAMSSPRPGYYPEGYRDEHDRGQLGPPTRYYTGPPQPQPYADELVLDEFGTCTMPELFLAISLTHPRSPASCPSCSR